MLRHALGQPHVSNYDLVLLAIAALWWQETPENRPAAAPDFALACYIAPLFNPPRAMPLGLVTPLVMLGLVPMLAATPGLAA